MQLFSLKLLKASLKKLYSNSLQSFYQIQLCRDICISCYYPPFKAENCIQFSINLACLHLYLSNNYHTINYKKFTEDFNLQPKSFIFTSHTTSTNQNGKYVTIKSDNKLNVNLLFNLPKSQFLEKFSIPSLKNSLDHFNK